MDLLSILPAFSNVAFTIVAFVVALSVIVAVHEYGHYIVGRWCGIHAEVFSLGFGPRLYCWTDKRGTVWQIAALPFGGYVKFLGDADAASGKDSAVMDSIDPSALERTMHGARLWKRSATVAAGPVFNFILSIVVFAGMAVFQGQAIETPTVGVLKDTPAVSDAEGLLPGDRILSVGGILTPDYAAFYEAVDGIDPPSALDYLVDRDGRELTVRAPFAFPPLIEGIQPQSAAIAAKLKIGDVITAIDGEPIAAFRQLREAVAASDGNALELKVWRSGEIFDITLSPKRTDLPAAEGGFETRWLIGVTGGLLFEPATEFVGPFQAMTYGAAQTLDVISNSLSGLYHMITGAISSCNLQGPIGIAEISGQAASQGTQNFIWLIAVLSTAVGLINLFPIPVLDGGHLVFHAYEAAFGRPPSDRALQVMMSTGLALIMSFMAFALWNDVFCP
ncbi:MAG: RIP metalloprotease RseP [Pseudomonadota bacterium]